MLEFSRDRWERSASGWTYCLATPCRTYCKIGMTKKSRVMDRYPSIYIEPRAGNSEMILKWAVPNYKYESQFHRALRRYRINIIPKQFAGKKYPEEMKHTCLKWLKKRHIPSDYTEDSTEIFFIQPAIAKRIIKDKVHPVI